MLSNEVMAEWRSEGREAATDQDGVEEISRQRTGSV